MKKALVFGASGLVGTFILEELLRSPDYHAVTAVVRKPLNIQHPKLKTITGNYQTLPNLQQQLTADEIYLALGTTRKKTPDKKLYYEIDHDYPVLAAQLAKTQGARSVFLVSVVGANSRSGLFYVRTKGETERDIIALQYAHTAIFQPSMITGNRIEKRLLENTLSVTWKLINPLLVGGLKKYRSMQGKDIAKAMVRAARQTTGTVTYFCWPDMKALL